MSFISRLALTIGTVASLAAVATPASARPYYGGGYGGYHNYGGYGGYRGGYGGGYGGGYRHRDNTGAIVAGALLLGGIAAIASSNHNRGYDDRYRGDGYYYRGEGGPVYSAPPRGGYYEQRSYEERSYGSPYGDSGRYDSYGY